MPSFGWLFVAAALLTAAPAAAEVIQVPLDKAYLIRLKSDAKVVMVADPTIADAVIESPRLIFLLGKRPGVTNIFVLDDAGREVIGSDVIVLPDDGRHVTVHRSEAESTLSCTPRCVVVGASNASATRGAAAAAAPAAPAPAPAAPLKQ